MLERLIAKARAKAILGRQFLERGNTLDAVIASAELQGLVVLISRSEATTFKNECESLALDLKGLSEQLELSLATPPPTWAATPN
jgi:hypothetical protein